MKLKLEEEEGYGRSVGIGPWYRITADGRFINGNTDLESMQKLFEKIKANPDIINDRNVLKSEEISVSL